MAGTTNNDSICRITWKTHAPPLKHPSDFPILVWQVKWTWVEAKKRMNLAY